MKRRAEQKKTRTRKGGTAAAKLLVLPLLIAALSSCLLLMGPSDSPYITEVYEYVYGPGQHASLAEPSTGELLVGDDSSYVLLGGWGGYIIAGFDHTVVNQHARYEGYDFAVYTQKSVGNEPGSVYVMQDENRNGLPDDTWYEISGSETGKEGYKRDYRVRYYKPEQDGENIFWKDSEGNSGELINGYGETDSGEKTSSYSWWWNYTEYEESSSWSFARTGEDTEGIYCEFSGVLLPDAKEPSGSGWIDREGLFTHGYAEVYDGENTYSIPFGDSGISRKANLFDISDAVDASGNPADLEGIDFIRVQTGVFQCAGWLNEVSTEISGAADLSLLDEQIGLEGVF